MSEPLSPEEEDEALLREIESKIKEVTTLMIGKANRNQADDKVREATERVEKHRGSKESTYHKQQGGHIATTMHTRAHLELGDALKLRIQLGEYALDLEDSLRRLSERYVEVLKRQLKRCRY